MSTDVERRLCEAHAEWLLDKLSEDGFMADVCDDEPAFLLVEERIRSWRAEAFEAGHKDAIAEFIEGKTALEGTCRDLSVMLAACKAKLARVEATLMSDWCKAAGYVHRADDFGRLHAELRAALADSVEKP